MPLVSLSVDYYVRIFVRVYTSPAEVKKSASKMGYLLHCSSCTSHEVVPMMQTIETKTKKGGTSVKYKLGHIPMASACKQCQSGRIQVAGPCWIDPLFDDDVLKQLMDHLSQNQGSYNSYSRLFGLLTAMANELRDVPFLYSVSRLCKVLHVDCPSLVCLFKLVYTYYNFKYRAQSKLRSSMVDTKFPVLTLTQLQSKLVSPLLYCH